MTPVFHGIIHHLRGDDVYASRGNGIYISEDRGDTWRHLVSIPLHPVLRLKSCTHLGSRLFRCGVHHIACLADRVLVMIAFKRIYHYDLRRDALHTAADLVGSRPLSLCAMNDTLLFYGEYSGRRRGGLGRIFMSDDRGMTWEPVYQFTGVRHIHGVYHDPYTDAVWVTTGDADEESGIWVTEDRFRSVRRVVGGSQQARAVQLLFSENHIYFGSDAPRQKNHLYRIPRHDPVPEMLQEVDGPVFYGCRAGGGLFFSTVVEPSTKNREQCACVWASADGERWERMARFPKDRWHMRLFQYGQVIFPSGENTTDHLFLTPFATDRSMTGLRLNLKEVLHRGTQRQGNA